MKKILLLYLLSAPVFFSCLPQNKVDKIENYKVEVMETEKAFAHRVAENGIAEAFEFYAADDAVLLRNDRLFLGKDAIINLYATSKNDQHVSLTWNVDFVDVSSSGDLAYTYGEYQYSVSNKEGNTELSRGIFHTVWKKQDNGEWRYVWD